MSAQTILDTVLVVVTRSTVAGTIDNPVARALVDIPNDLNFGQLPAVVVTCTKTVEKRFDMRHNQETHTILVEYLDAPEATSNQREGIQAARAWLETAKHNLRTNRLLENPPGTQNGWMQLQFTSVINEPFDDKDSARILIHGQFEVDVMDQPVQFA